MYEGTFAPALKMKRNAVRKMNKLDINAGYFTASPADESLLS
jgi:hypothetical protein